MTRPAVLVTGGAKRLGRAIVERFAEAGWHVVIHYHRSAKAAEVLAASLPSARTVQCDLADGDAAAAMVERLAGELPDWRALVNCASIFVPDDVTDLDPATYSKTMQINAQSPTRMAQAYLRDAPAGGEGGAGRRVIQVTDQKLKNPNPDFFSYTISKQALDGGIVPMAMAAGATAPDDRIYGLAPGAILPSHDQSKGETEASHVLNLLGRRTGAREVADAALFLARGHLASGQTLFVDSGQHLLNQPRDVIYLAREQGNQRLTT